MRGVSRFIMGRRNPFQLSSGFDRTQAVPRDSYRDESNEIINPALFNTGTPFGLSLYLGLPAKRQGGRPV